MLSRLKARDLLAECDGDEIWSIEHCRQRGIPQVWIDELVDCYESGFARESTTIYHQERRVNQYQGVRDLDLAIKLAEFLGADTSYAQACVLGRRAQVQALKEAVDE